MAKSLNQEWLAYMYQKKENEFWPVTATVNLTDNSLSPAPTKREDVLKVPDETTFPSGNPGGWLTIINTGSSAVNKWAVLRGDFLFFFKDEKSGNPTSVIPLKECKSIADSPVPLQDKATHCLQCTFTNTEYQPVTIGCSSAEATAEWRKELTERMTRRTKQDKPPTKETITEGWPKKGRSLFNDTSKCSAHGMVFRNFENHGYQTAGQGGQATAASHCSSPTTTSSTSCCPRTGKKEVCG